MCTKPEDFGSPEHWVSECCGEGGLHLRVDDEKAVAVGTCSRCQKKSIFVPEDDGTPDSHPEVVNHRIKHGVRH